MGYPLARTQTELTDSQRYFLTTHVWPEMERLYGGGALGKMGQPVSSDSKVPPRTNLTRARADADTANDLRHRVRDKRAMDM